jgi:hypothetical protein
MPCFLVVSYSFRFIDQFKTLLCIRFFGQVLRIGTDLTQVIPNNGQGITNRPVNSAKFGCTEGDMANLGDNQE